MRAFLVTLFAVAMFAAATGCGSSGGASTARQTHATTTRAKSTARPSAPAETFVSKADHFRVALTKDWSESDATERWDGSQLPGITSPTLRAVQRSHQRPHAPGCHGTTSKGNEALRLESRDGPRRARSLRRVPVRQDDDARGRAGPGLDVQVQRRIPGQQARRSARKSRLRRPAPVARGGEQHRRRESPRLRVHAALVSLHALVRKPETGTVRAGTVSRRAGAPDPGIFPEMAANEIPNVTL